MIRERFEIIRSIHLELIRKTGDIVVFADVEKDYAERVKDFIRRSDDNPSILTESPCDLDELLEQLERSIRSIDLLDEVIYLLGKAEACLDGIGQSYISNVYLPDELQFSEVDVQISTGVN
jgi:hypothetical protein